MKKNKKGLRILIVLIVIVALAILSVGIIHICKNKDDNKDNSNTLPPEPTTHSNGDVHYYLTPLMDSSYRQDEKTCIGIKLVYNETNKNWEAIDILWIYNDSTFMVGDSTYNKDGFDQGTTVHDMSWSSDYYEKMFTYESALETESDIFILTNEQHESNEDYTRNQLSFYKLKFCTISDDHVLNETQVGDFLSNALN